MSRAESRQLLWHHHLRWFQQLSCLSSVNVWAIKYFFLDPQNGTSLSIESIEYVKQQREKRCVSSRKQEYVTRLFSMWTKANFETLIVDRMLFVDSIYFFNYVNQLAPACIKTRWFHFRGVFFFIACFFFIIIIVYRNFSNHTYTEDGYTVVKKLRAKIETRG